MKTRSEVLAEKKKSSATERTVPIQTKPSGKVTCPECEEKMDAEGLSVRPDGFLECAECGAPIPTKKQKTPEEKALPKEEVNGVSTRVDTKKKEEPKKVPKAYCGTCGADWAEYDGKLFKNCGHKDAVEVSDPRMAKEIKPPAGLPVTKTPETSPPAHIGNAVTPQITLSGNRLSIGWGEASFPIVDQYNRVKVPTIIATVDLGPDDDRVEVARKVLEDLQKIADLTFDTECAWYRRKLRQIERDDK